MSLRRDLRTIRSRRSIRALRERIKEMTVDGPVALHNLVVVCVNQHLQQRSYEEEDARSALAEAYTDAVQSACSGGAVKLRDTSPTELAKSLSTDTSLRFFVDGLYPAVLKGEVAVDTEEDQNKVKEGVIFGLQELLRIQMEPLGVQVTEEDRQLLRERAEDRLDGLIHFRLAHR